MMNIQNLLKKTKLPNVFSRKIFKFPSFSFSSQKEKFDFEDPLNLNSLLNDEEKMVINSIN